MEMNLEYCKGCGNVVYESDGIYLLYCDAREYEGDLDILPEIDNCGCIE
jgi:hypothetical protein